MQMEYEQPIHIEHETESTDEETEHPTEVGFQQFLYRSPIGWGVKSPTLIGGWRHRVGTNLKTFLRMISLQQTHR